jgi:hypothetical protein
VKHTFASAFALLSATLAICLIAPAAQATLREVSSSSDSGSFPFPIASASVDRPTALAYEVASSSAAIIEVKPSVHCYGENRDVGQDIYVAPQPGPISGQIPITVPDADDCSVTVTASYQDFEQTGTLTARILADQRPNWVACGKPGYAERGLLEAHEVGCGTARSVTTAAVKKPENQGHYVTLRGWGCSRSMVSVRCTKDDQVIRFRGKVK